MRLRCRTGLCRAARELGQLIKARGRITENRTDAPSQSCALPHSRSQALLTSGHWAPLPFTHDAFSAAQQCDVPVWPNLLQLLRVSCRPTSGLCAPPERCSTSLSITCSSSSTCCRCFTAPRPSLSASTSPTFPRTACRAASHGLHRCAPRSRPCRLQADLLTVSRLLLHQQGENGDCELHKSVARATRK